VDWEPVHKNKYYHHVTLAYGSIDSLPDFIGQNVTFVADRYFCNEEGEAVTGSFTDTKINDYAAEHGQTLHCTISCANGVKPVYSNEFIRNTRGSLFEYSEDCILDCKVGAFVKHSNGSVGWVFDKEEKEG
jgi:hypothetical protein